MPEDASARLQQIVQTGHSAELFEARIEQICLTEGHQRTTNPGCFASFCACQAEQGRAALGSTDQAKTLTFLEFLEWKALDRPVIHDQERIALSAAMAKRLRSVRLTLDKTEEEAAEVAGVSLNSYLTYERRGPRRWGTSKITRYCEAWNVSLDWFYDGKGEMFRTPGPGQRRPEANKVVALKDWRR